MNTVFKLDYQAWLLLGLAGIGALAWRREWLPRRAARWAFTALAAVVLAAAAVYPVAGTYARKDGFDRAPTLDGLGWLRDRAPGDVGAIAWLERPRAGRRRRARGGRRGLLGLRPRADLDVHRPADGARLARARAPVGARRRRPGGRGRAGVLLDHGRGGAPVLDRHGVRYVVVGPLERTDYGDAGVAKWDVLGERVFDADGTIGGEIVPPPP